MTQFLYRNRSFEQSEEKIKKHIIEYIPLKILSLLRRHWIQNIEQNQKLKAKDTETRKTKTQKNENLFLPKE